MGFDFQKYIDFHDRRELVEAENYRMSNIPIKLYKYIGLTRSSDNPSTINKELDKKKLNTIASSQLWLTNYKNFNDPFECKMLYIDKIKLANAGWPIGYVNKQFNKFKNINLIASFTTHLDDNLPMWAHYANNHSGICIEYEVVSPEHIYPVSYEKNRIPIATVITQALSRFGDYNRFHKRDDELDFYMKILYLTAIMKDKAWQYENEYRILFPNYTNSNGEALPLNSIGLKISKIFIGINCETKYRTVLKRISNSLGCELSEMYLDEDIRYLKLSNKNIQP